MASSRFLPLRCRVAILATVVVGFAGNASADIDLTGRWRIGTDNYATIVQTADQLHITWSQDIGGGGPTAFHMTGTFNQSTFSASDASGFHLGMQQYGDGARLDGTLARSGFLTYLREHWVRCECFDGNSVDGDGCDALCQVEPCYSCTPEPSACAPSADSDPCDDRSDCTIGETCSAGVCGNGEPVPSCVDMTGSWRVRTEVYDWILGETQVSATEARYVQRKGALMRYSTTSGLDAIPNSIGAIDPMTGTYDLVARGGSYFCSISSSVDGQASLDNRSYSATGAYYWNHIRGCWSTGFAEQAYRCDDELGCNLASCEGWPDGSACRDDDPCTTAESCVLGTCTGRPKCALCSHCDQEGDCIVAPKPSCTRSLRPERSFVKATNMHNGVDIDLRWNWKGGPAMTLEDFGTPQTSDDVSLCVYGDESGVESLLYSEDLLSDPALCAEPPCWTTSESRLRYRPRGEQRTAFSGLELRSGAAGKSSIRLRLHGAFLGDAFLPMPAPVPLRTQLQVGNGACFELELEAGGVRSNTSLLLKANGTPLPE